MQPSAVRVAFRQLLASSLDDALDTLADLARLDAQLQGLTDAFEGSMRVAASKLPKEVVSQMDALKAARNGLASAQNAQNAIEGILSSYPDDKTAQRAAKDADVMVRRFQRHVDDAAKMIRTLSKKTMPPALTKMAAAAVRAIKKRLVDPNSLTILHWQIEDQVYVEAARNYYNPGAPSTWTKGITHQVVFEFTGEGLNNGKARFALSQSTLTRVGPFIGEKVGFKADSAKSTTAKEFVGHVLDRLENWEGLVGAADTNAARAGVAQDIAQTLKSLGRRMGDDADRSPEISKDNSEIHHATRQGIREEDYGEYDESWHEGVARLSKRVEEALKPYAKHIKRTDSGLGEKGWFEMNVYLK